MRLGLLLGAVGVGLLSVAAVGGDAGACGGSFAPPSQNGDVTTDHRMIFRVTPTQTTLYDEIEYKGDPQSFAWVLPIKGPVTVGLSADIVFAALDQVTQTTIIAPTLPQCPSCDCDQGHGGSSSSSSGSSSGGGGGGVTVIGQQVVGPYDTEQLQSTDPNALVNWLTANGFAIPSDIQPVIAAYVNEGFDFLAIKLLPGQGVQAMRPVRVTTPGAGLTLPLRMVQAGTGSQVGITLWVIGDGRYEAQNFQNFVVSPEALVWDWSAGASNYSTVQQQMESKYSFAAWQTESSMQIAPQEVIGTVMADPADQDYLPVPPSDAGAEGGAGEPADNVRGDDLNTLFPGDTSQNVTITRMRGDIAHAALANDLVLQASSDQSQISNIYQVTQSVNAPTCPPVPNPCPPCGGASSGSSSGASTSSGAGGATSTQTASPGKESFGCSAVPSDGGDVWVDVALGGLLGASILRGRLRRRR